MKLTCEIVRDLLPLYEDSVCSPESRAAVEEHLCGCENCAREHRQLHAFTVAVPQKPLAEKAAAKSFRKVRRRWALSLVAVLILLPLLAGLGWLGYNQSRQEGICFTNLDEAALAARFGRLLAAGDYEKAAQLLDFSREYDSIQEALALDWEEYLPDRVPITADGQSYMVTPALAQLQERDASFWSYLIFNAECHLAPIPEAAFLEAAAQNRELLQDTNGVYFLADGSSSFLLMELDWGSFYVTQSRWLELYQRKDDPVSLCYTLELMPESLYQQTLPALEAYAREGWQSSQDWNGSYAGVSLEEYTRQQQALFVQEVSRVAGNMTIQYEGITYTYCIDGEWSIQIDLDVTAGGDTQRIRLDLRIREGKLSIISTGFAPSNRNTVFEDLTSALQLDIQSNEP